MDRKRFALSAGTGCAFFALFISIAFLALAIVTAWIPQLSSSPASGTSAQERQLTPHPVPTLTLPPEKREPRPTSEERTHADSESLVALYQQLAPGVVNIRVYVRRGLTSGQGAGSGFILDNEGHIITNNHVVADAERITVIFYNGIETKAEIVGADGDSDLAVIQVETLAQGTHPLPLADSTQVKPGETVVAIGNPFGLGGSMTAGIVSAVGRTIPSGITSFAIPQAIQTDAAVNPGNSGGPLVNLDGQIIGVNAQIATGGTQVSAGVGFAIPSNVVRRVAPALIQRGSHQWPWLGVEGTSVDLAIMQANDLETQQGAYISEITPDSPADKAGLQGSSGSREIDGIRVPVGGDVVIMADGQPVRNFNDLLAHIMFKALGDKVTLTILRNGQRQQLTAELAPRPSSL